MQIQYASSYEHDEISFSGKLAIVKGTQDDWLFDGLSEAINLIQSAHPEVGKLAPPNPLILLHCPDLVVKLN